MTNKIKIDPDHQTLERGIITAGECDAGGWADFEKWSGISFFGKHLTEPERYGTIREDKGSRFPIVDKTEGALNERLEQRSERFEDFDE